jgi:AraC-like DNA-binding protein
VISCPHGIQLAEIKGADPRSGRSFGSAKAVLVRHMLRPYWTGCEECARQTGEPGVLRTGATLIEDLRRMPHLSMQRPFHAVDIIIPWGVFDEIAALADGGPIETLATTFGTGVEDHTIRHLARALLPALRAGDGAQRQFTDHLALALAAHVARTYGAATSAGRSARGGLPPHVLRQAQMVLQANLQAGLTRRDLAESCGLSPRHFTRAFEESTGMTPHRWLTRARVAAAKSMIEGGAASLAEIANACGFADQSHLTRVFQRLEGMAPAAWRRVSGETRRDRGLVDHEDGSCATGSQAIQALAS